MSTPVHRDRIIVLAGLAAIAAPAWYYTAVGAWEMTHMDQAPNMFMPHSGPWTATEFGLLFVMWVLMMVAMMLPSVAPLTVKFAHTARCANCEPYTPTALFVLGYLFAWTLFSGAATVAQWGLHQAALLSPMMVSRNYIFGGLVLLTAGIFQWTSWKHMCLGHCRTSPRAVEARWKPGAGRAFREGFDHGVCCMGCCWAVMALLFVTGVMDLRWVVAITTLVLVERLLPGGPWLARAAGAAFTVWGLYVLGHAGS